MKTHKFLQVRFGWLVMLVLGLSIVGLPSALLHPAAAQQDRLLRQATSTPAPAAKRLALVMGNGAYANAPTLKNPPNDARDMAEALTKLGFEVVSGVDLNQRQMKTMIRQFGLQLKAGGQGVFYYAGHGVQSKGRNYLIPVDAQIESEAEIEDAGVDVQLVLNFMDDAQNGLNIVMLDACRNNPFGRSMRSAENGLAQVDAPTGTLIAYSTAPGRVASDGTGRNGLYTAELLKQMTTPGLSIYEMFMRVRAEVVRQTNGKQVPWEASSLIGSFSFSAPAKPGSDPPARLGAALADAGAVEAVYWDSIKDSNDPADYSEYLKEYPQGRYAQLARLKLRQFEARNKPTGNSGAGDTAGGNRPGPTSGGVGNAQPKAGTLMKNTLGMEFAYIPAGSFMMGSSDTEIQQAFDNARGNLGEKAKREWFTPEGPQRRVTIGSDIYLGRYEVTQAQWQAVMGTNPSKFSDCAQCPVERVSWNDIQEFINKLNARNDGYSYRLPSEAEWEYAARAGTTTPFAFGSSLSSAQANFNGDYPYGGAAEGEYLIKTTPVGSFSPNAWGMYDMHGNVWEWCQDWYGENYYSSGLAADPPGPSSGTARVVRGGSWTNYAFFLRSALRNFNQPADRNGLIGFRLAAVSRTP